MNHRRHKAIADTIESLADAGLETSISQETGLSPQVVRHGLATSFHDLREELSCIAALPGARASSGFIALAGNVFSACLRPFATAAVLEVPLQARVSSRESAFATALGHALKPFCDIELLRFPNTDDASFRAAIQSADFCEAYGSDETLDALSVFTPTMIRRGHGLGVVLLGASIDDLAYDALAEDIAAYDQRGCLSPRVVFAEGELEAHAEKLDDSLTRVEERLPRGEVSTDVQAASSQWRGTAAALHPLRESPSHAIVVDEMGGFPIGPTHRHVVIRPMSLAQEALARLGSHTKVIGHAGLQAPPKAPCRVCDVGQMQRPRLSAAADGYAAGAGFILES
ncbi:MAG: acyl-CoA reductase [Polyangiales bacterium]